MSVCDVVETRDLEGLSAECAKYIKEHREIRVKQGEGWDGGLVSAENARLIATMEAIDKPLGFKYLKFQQSVRLGTLNELDRGRFEQKILARQYGAAVKLLEQALERELGEEERERMQDLTDYLRSK